VNVHRFAAAFGERPTWRSESQLERMATEAGHTVPEMIEMLRDVGYEIAQRRGGNETFYCLVRSPNSFGCFTLDALQRESAKPS
jgi:hypothetical protein